VLSEHLTREKKKKRKVLPIEEEKKKSKVSKFFPRGKNRAFKANL